jgi:nicotinate-nucleotide pyrophosphorylase
MNNALKQSVDILLNVAIAEDKSAQDATSKLLLGSEKISTGIYFKEPGILCGTKTISYLAKQIDAQIKIKWNYKEGARIKKGSLVAKISGPANLVLSHERIVLNFLQKLSGIATLTNKYVAELKKTKIKILDTRKTTPGWRHLEKYAVQIGGGQNHRVDLSESILVKDNHIRAHGGIKKTLEKIAQRSGRKKISVEVENLGQVKDVVQFKIDQIMLDNFSKKETLSAIKIIRNSNKARIELSGGFTLKKIKSIRNLDVDYVSIGRITHSAPFLDISMGVLR